MLGSRGRRVATQVACSLVLVQLAACSLVAGPPPTLPAGATVRLTVDLPSASQNSPCAGEIRWTLSPRQPTGPAGQKEQWTTVEQQWVRPTQNPDQTGAFVCKFTSAPIVLLSTGVWRFAFSAHPYSGSCLVTLRDGLNNLVYRDGSGCPP